MRAAFLLLFVLSPLAAQVFDEVRNLTKAGITAYQQKKLTDARKYLAAALDIDSTWVPAVLHHGQVYADLLSAELHIRNTRQLIGFEKYEKAEVELDEAEGIFPEHPMIP